MNPELAKMSLAEVSAWVDSRRAEIGAAAVDGRISGEVFLSLADWITDSYCEYLYALSTGLITWAD